MPEKARRESTATGDCCVCAEPLSGRQRRYCSSRCKQKAHYDRVRANPNTAYSQTLRSLRRKVRFVKERGGACMVCGYARNLAALAFHHRDPRAKRFALDARNLSNRSMRDLRRELDQCDLLCANCHAEAHYPESEWAAVIAFLDSVR